MKSHVVRKPKRIPNQFRTGVMVMRMMDVKAIVMMMSLTLRPSRTSHIMMIGYSLLHSIRIIMMMRDHAVMH